VRYIIDEDCEDFTFSSVSLGEGEGFSTANIITWQKETIVSAKNSTKKIAIVACGVAVVSLNSNIIVSTTPTSMVVEQISNKYVI
jgi:hypothetical protein